MISLSEFAAPTRWLPLRLALRELRAGVRGFYVFIACIALGVMAISGVASVAASLSDGLAREGRPGPRFRTDELWSERRGVELRADHPVTRPHRRRKDG